MGDWHELTVGEHSFSAREREDGVLECQGFDLEREQLAASLTGVNPPLAVPFLETVEHLGRVHGVDGVLEDFKKLPPFADRALPLHNLIHFATLDPLLVTLEFKAARLRLDVPESVIWWCARHHPTIASFVADANGRLPERLASEVAKSTHLLARMMVASHPDLPAPDLERLLGDPDLPTRTRALANPALTPEMLRRAQETHGLIGQIPDEFVAACPAAPPDLLWELWRRQRIAHTALSGSQLVRNLRKNPNTPLGLHAEMSRQINAARQDEMLRGPAQPTADRFGS